MSDLKKQIETLVEKAANAEKAHDAMQFAQAALNAANVALSFETVRLSKNNK